MKSSVILAECVHRGWCLECRSRLAACTMHIAQLNWSGEGGSMLDLYCDGKAYTACPRRGCSASIFWHFKLLVYSKSTQNTATVRGHYTCNDVSLCPLTLTKAKPNLSQLNLCTTVSTKLRPLIHIKTGKGFKPCNGAWGTGGNFPTAYSLRKLVSGSNAGWGPLTWSPLLNFLCLKVSLTLMVLYITLEAYNVAKCYHARLPGWFDSRILCCG